MKVHRFWNQWYDHYWLLLLLLLLFDGMLMQRQHYILAAVVESEIFKFSSSSSSSSGKYSLVSDENNNNDNIINSIERHSWPSMKNHDIWSDISAYENDTISSSKESTASDNNVIQQVESQDELKILSSNIDSEIKINKFFNQEDSMNRTSKVIHIFPVPVDGECLADDGRRTGTCFNAYECRQKGGAAKGQCAMGFGVCCIFIAKCNETIINNITYLESPQFPSFMPNNFTSCSIKIKLMSEEISQLRFDFNHFSLGQPNRRTGVCDGDVFNISGGPGGIFSLCGQNSGQHLYYDVGGRALPRQTLYGNLRPPTLAQIYPNLNLTTAANQIIDISMYFAQRFLPIRLWEIRIAQIPFSQRAPAGCLQYHTGSAGIIQTFNFADNGRHLANQHYRVCMRQEMDMCSIMYQPCDEQSFRIGPSNPRRGLVQPNSDGGGGGSIMPLINAGTMQTGTFIPSTTTTTATSLTGASSVTMMSTLQSSIANQMNMTMPTTMSTTSPAATMRTSAAMSSTSATQSSLSTSTISSTTASIAITMPSTTIATTESTATTAIPTTATTSSIATTSTTIATSPLSDDVEGSGDDGSVTPGTFKISRRPRPVSGGFDLLGFLRSAFHLGLRHRRSISDREQRQIFNTCSDRITLPCIIEDFIGTGLGPLPSCEPVHCGNQFCSSGVWPCRIESTVTPFFVNIHFGDGMGKGNPEDNIGACLRYTQVQCM